MSWDNAHSPDDAKRPDLTHLMVFGPCSPLSCKAQASNTLGVTVEREWAQ